jgi:hypothetical protein
MLFLPKNGDSVNDIEVPVKYFPPILFVPHSWIQILILIFLDPLTGIGTGAAPIFKSVVFEFSNSEHRIMVIKQDPWPFIYK